MKRKYLLILLAVLLLAGGISIEYQGRTNLIEICDGRIRVAEADCPDQLCVQMGWLQNSGLPVVCLPNRLVIQYAQSLDGLDAIS